MRCQPFCPTNVAAVLRRATKWLVLLGLCVLTWNACGGSPTAPSVPPADFAAQFDSLWTTFDREYSRWIEYTADNQVIEDVGISPRVFVTAGPGDFTQGRDPVLDWALNARPQ